MFIYTGNNHYRNTVQNKKKKITSICLRVFATSNGHVAAAAMLPATKPAEKFAPKILTAFASSPTRLSSLLLICPESK
jgi:hypothetical protein